MSISSRISRTPLRGPLKAFIPIVSSYYQTIGPISSFQIIEEGYEDLNVLLNTKNDRYVLKIFASDASESFAQQYTEIITKAKESGVETLEIISGKNSYLSVYNNVFFLLTKFFQGKNFENTTPTLNDMIKVTDNLARLNNLQIKIKGTYDSWGNANLIHEFEHTKVKDKKVLDRIKPIVENLKQIDFSGFSRAVIHGDIQRKHVLKNDNSYCIIDYGCARYDFKIYEISTLLSWFCLAEDTWKDRDTIIESVLSKYNETHKLTEQEITAVKVLIPACYAAYLLKTTELIESGDNSKETKDWNMKASKMLTLSKDWI